MIVHFAAVLPTCPGKIDMCPGTQPPAVKNRIFGRRHSRDNVGFGSGVVSRQIGLNGNVSKLGRATNALRQFEHA